MSKTSTSQLWTKDKPSCEDLVPCCEYACALLLKKAKLKNYLEMLLSDNLCQVPAKDKLPSCGVEIYCHAANVLEDLGGFGFMLTTHFLSTSNCCTLSTTLNLLAAHSVRTIVMAVL